MCELYGCTRQCWVSPPWLFVGISFGLCNSVRYCVCWIDALRKHCISGVVYVLIVWLAFTECCRGFESWWKAYREHWVQQKYKLLVLAAIFGSAWGRTVFGSALILPLVRKELICRRSTLLGLLCFADCFILDFWYKYAEFHASKAHRMRCEGQYVGFMSKQGYLYWRSLSLLRCSIFWILTTYYVWYMCYVHRAYLIGLTCVIFRTFAPYKHVLCVFLYRSSIKVRKFRPPRNARLYCGAINERSNKPTAGFPKIPIGTLYSIWKQT